MKLESSREDAIPQIDLSNFPSIEIDSEYWKTLSPNDRVKYLIRLVFHEKNMGDKLKMLNYIVKTSCKIGKALVKNREVREYLTVLEYTGDMLNTSMAFGNLFKAKQSYRSTKNNEIARLMGFPNGSHIEELELDVTNAMVEAFLEITESAKQRYGIVIDNIINDDGKKGGSDEEDGANVSINKKVTIVGSYGVDGEESKGFKFGMVFNLVGSVFDGETAISVTKGKLFHPVTGMDIDPDELEDEIHKMFRELYIEKVDASNNFIRINGTRFEVCPRITISEDIVNVDIKRVTTACKKTLNEKRRRGVVLVGEPGTGKTIAVHKIMNNFRDKLIFWVSADSINTPSGIRNVRKLFKMFEGCIVVFDDMDAAPLTSKNETTNEFLAMLDGTNKMSCFLIATVNDPSKIHMSLINRAERFDDIVYVKKPQTIEEVSNILISKAHEFGYYFRDEVTEYPSLSIRRKGYLDFKKSAVKFKKSCTSVLENGFTQVMVAGLIRDCDTYSETGDISIESIDSAIENRLESIKCANMKAIKGRLEVDMNDISEEAKASMHSSHR